MNKLRQMNECLEPIGAFLDLIQSEMLVADKEDRKSMADIRNGLRTIYDQARLPGGFSYPDVSLQTDLANSPGHSEGGYSIQNHYQMQLESSENLQDPTSEPTRSEASLPIDHSQILIEELARMAEAGMKQPDTGTRAVSSSTDVVHHYPDQQAILHHSLHHENEELDTFDHRVGNRLDVDMNLIPNHHHLSASDSRTGSSRIILFTSPNGEGFLPYITATASSAEVSRRNSQESISLTSTDDSSEDNACLDSPWCQERSQPNYTQSSENTPLLLSSNEAPRQDHLGVGSRSYISDEAADRWMQPRGGSSNWWLRILCGCFLARSCHG